MADPLLPTTVVGSYPQPDWLVDRELLKTMVPRVRVHELWRVASLRRAGVPMALSTDMPFGDADPWAAMRAAFRRTTGAGAVLGADECVSAREALTMFFGAVDRPVQHRTIAPGQPGDVCVLAAPPGEVLAELDAGMVAATIVGGQLVYERG